MPNSPTNPTLAPIEVRIPDNPPFWSLIAEMIFIYGLIFFLMLFPLSFLIRFIAKKLVKQKSLFNSNIFALIISLLAIISIITIVHFFNNYLSIFPFGLFSIRDYRNILSFIYMLIVIPIPAILTLFVLRWLDKESVK